MTALTRCGYVALLGVPNAGKSTLSNQLVGAKVSIVTPKVQTTRARITAIAMADDTQMIFVDTPGIFEPRRDMDRAMVDAAWSGADDADLILLLVDAARGLDERVITILDRLKSVKSPVALVLNKIDLVARPKLLALAAEAAARYQFTKVFMVSAENGDGVADIRAWVAAALPEGPWLYPPDQLADIPERLLAAEITREQIFLRLHEELPYASTVETESYKSLKDGSLRLEQTIYVERDSQKAIVLGKGGRTIKELGALARAELEKMLDCRVHLFLFVKVRENWMADRERLTAMGLEPAPVKKKRKRPSK